MHVIDIKQHRHHKSVCEVTQCPLIIPTLNTTRQANRSSMARDNERTYNYNSLNRKSSLVNDIHKNYFVTAAKHNIYEKHNICEITPALPPNMFHVVFNGMASPQCTTYRVSYIFGDALSYAYTVKPVYNDHLMGYFSAFWSSSRWPKAT